MEFHETEEQREVPTKAIYSKIAILFSIIFSPLAGGILLMLNLRSAGYKKQGSLVLFFAIAYQLVSGILISTLFKNISIHANAHAIVSNTKFITYSLIVNIIGGGILAEYFFKKYFPDNNYERKSIWKPLIIIFLISVSLTFIGL